MRTTQDRKGAVKGTTKAAGIGLSAQSRPSQPRPRQVRPSGNRPRRNLEPARGIRQRSVNDRLPRQNSTRPPHRHHHHSGRRSGGCLSTIAALIIMLAPFVPHVTEELWQIAGGEGSVHDQMWVSYDETALVKDETEIVVQINGKVKDKMMISTGLSDDEIKAVALANEKIVELTSGKEIVKVIVVKGKLVNIVIK